MGDKVEYVTTYWVEGDTLVQRCDTLEGCDLIHERIVRCRDCKHMHTEKNYVGMDIDWCEHFLFCTEPDGFCSWGRRK